MGTIDGFGFSTERRLKDTWRLFHARAINMNMVSMKMIVEYAISLKTSF